jgi:hypothetical protein
MTRHRSLSNAALEYRYDPNLPTEQRLIHYRSEQSMNLTRAEMKRLVNLASTKQVHDAAHQYIRLKRRQEHPVGRFDNANRFWLKCEHACGNVRRPSRMFPSSLMTHASSLEHVAHAHGVPERVSDIRR